MDTRVLVELGASGLEFRNLLSCDLETCENSA